MRIYVHIPFCERKCKYCNFASGVHPEATQIAYFFALNNELRIASRFIAQPVESVYIGGGTPSSVNPKLIAEIMQTIKTHFQVNKTAECTIEANPNSITPEKLETYKNSGLNRISFGAQSFDPNTLQTLGRTHTPEQIFDAVKSAHDSGFNNINVDLILGVKKFKNLKTNVQKLKESGLTHISAYMLILEDNTPLKHEVSIGKIQTLTDDESVDEYEKAKTIFEGLGFNRYEISNFAKSGSECKHNKGYWQCEEYYGAGLNAHSYVDGKRFYNTENLEKYILKFGVGELNKNNEKIKKINKKILKNTEKIRFFNKKYKKITKFNNFFKNNTNKNKIFQTSKFRFTGERIYQFAEAVEHLTKSQKIEEYIMLALRTEEGINLNHLQKLGCDIKKEKAEEIKFLQAQNAIALTPTHLKIAPAFFGVQNQIILKLI